MANILEKFKGMSTPKKVFIVGGGIVGIVLVIKTLSGNSSGAEVSSAQLSQNLSNGLSGGGSDSSSSGGGGSIDNVSYLSDYLDQLTEKFNDYQTNTNSIIQTMQDNVTAAQNENNFLNALVDMPSIYADSIDDAAQFKDMQASISQAVSSGSLTAAQGSKAVSVIAGLGNNGVAPQGGSYTSIDAVKANAESKAAEIARTQQVISNRSAAGYDTTLQQNWLKQLTS